MSRAAGDDIVYGDDFTGTTVSPTHDSNGNLTDDGTFEYEYDAWNRLVEVKTQHDNLTLATYSYDGLGRRIKKVVTNSGDLDGTLYFYCNDKWQMLESRDGSPPQQAHRSRFPSRSQSSPASVRLRGPRPYWFSYFEARNVGRLSH